MFAWFFIALACAVLPLAVHPAAKGFRERIDRSPRARVALVVLILVLFAELGRTIWSLVPCEEVGLYGAVLASATHEETRALLDVCSEPEETRIGRLLDELGKIQSPEARRELAKIHPAMR